MYSASITKTEAANILWRAPELVLRPLQLVLNAPAPLYLATLTICLFRPPVLDLYHADRIAFCLLCFFAALRMLALREKLPFIAGLSLPMLGLIGLATIRALREPFNIETWNLVANKFIVPFVLFHFAILIFRGPRERTQFDLFVLLTLAYLVFTAVAFLLGIPQLIFPRFILDPALGIHADRARGPFLQAVANGVTLNLLGLLAIAVSGRLKRRFVLLLWLALPWAVLATMTRSVWIGFAASTLAMAMRLAGKSRVRVWGVALVLCMSVGLAAVAYQPLRTSLSERMGDAGPVAARLAVYEAGWSMIQERPLTGWPVSSVYRELARRMPGYRLPEFYVHNTYLSLLLEFGWPGLALYGIIFFHLFRISKPPQVAESLFHYRLRKVWPLLLAVFLFNGFFVDMAYQFVIGLVFTVAGMLCAQAEART